MNRHDLSNKHVVLDNAKLVEKREETIWEKMANMCNNENVAPCPKRKAEGDLLASNGGRKA